MGTLNNSAIKFLPITITDRKVKTVRTVRGAYESWVIFQYEYIGRKWSDDDHMYSPDKDDYDHIYNELEVGKSYLIITANVQKKKDVVGGEDKGRWVWLEMVQMSPLQLRKVEKFLRQSHDRDKTLKYAMDLLYPVPNLDKFDEFFD